jgi:hypothetical protein
MEQQTYFWVLQDWEATLAVLLFAFTVRGHVRFMAYQ